MAFVLRNVGAGLPPAAAAIVGATRNPGMAEHLAWFASYGRKPKPDALTLALDARKEAQLYRTGGKNVRAVFPEGLKEVTADPYQFSSRVFGEVYWAQIRPAERFPIGASRLFSSGRLHTRSESQMEDFGLEDAKNVPQVPHELKNRLASLYLRWLLAQSQTPETEIEFTLSHDGGLTLYNDPSGGPVSLHVHNNTSSKIRPIKVRLRIYQERNGDKKAIIRYPGEDGENYFPIVGVTLFRNRHFLNPAQILGSRFIPAFENTDNEAHSHNLYSKQLIHFLATGEDKPADKVFDLSEKNPHLKLYHIGDEQIEIPLTPELWRNPKFKKLVIEAVDFGRQRRGIRIWAADEKGKKITHVNTYLLFSKHYFLNNRQYKRYPCGIPHLKVIPRSRTLEGRQLIYRLATNEGPIPRLRLSRYRRGSFSSPYSVGGKQVVVKMPSHLVRNDPKTRLALRYAEDDADARSRGIACWATKERLVVPIHYWELFKEGEEFKTHTAPQRAMGMPLDYFPHHGRVYETFSHYAFSYLLAHGGRDEFSYPDRLNSNGDLTFYSLKARSRSAQIFAIHPGLSTGNALRPVTVSLTHFSERVRGATIKVYKKAKRRTFVLFATNKFLTFAYPVDFDPWTEYRVERARNQYHQRYPFVSIAQILTLISGYGMDIIGNKYWRQSILERKDLFADLKADSYDAYVAWNLFLDALQANASHLVNLFKFMEKAEILGPMQDRLAAMRQSQKDNPHFRAVPDDVRLMALPLRRILGAPDFSRLDPMVRRVHWFWEVMTPEERELAQEEYLKGEYDPAISFDDHLPPLSLVTSNGNFDRFAPM